MKRTFRHQVRTYSEENYEAGKKVYYKLKSTKGWRGPTKVLGNEGNFVLIRHGSSSYYCHPCHLMKVNHTELSHQIGSNDSTTKSSTVMTKKKTNTKQLRMLNIVFEIDISDTGSDKKHTQETQNKSAVTDQEIQNNQESMKEQDEVEHTNKMPLLEDSEEEKVDSKEFAEEELQLNQEVAEEDSIEELKDRTMKRRPKTKIIII